MKLVLFDCDGTLVDSAHVIHDVMVRTFRDFGKADPDPQATRSIIGLTLDIAIARMLDRAEVDAEIGEMTQRYRSYFMRFSKDHGHHEPLFDGIREMMDTLSARENLLLGVVTGKSRRGLSRICENHLLEKTFVVTRTADDCPSKPHPAMVTECCAEAGINPRQTVVIGDSIYDMEMAKAAGARAIGVSWGYGGVEDLKHAGADAIAYQAHELLALLQEQD